MNFNTTFTPKFDVKTIYDEAINGGSAWLCSLVYELGDRMLGSIQTYINANSHREGRTGNLANSIKLYREPSTKLGEVTWGIGLISEMSKLAPYWYLINFGGLTTIAKEGRGVGGSFGGDAPDSAKRGTDIGTQTFTQGKDMFFMFPKNPIKPMNYIEFSRNLLVFEINQLLRQYVD